MDAAQADAVYELVVKGFAELGVSDPLGLSRSLLLRDLRYAGQVFRCEGWWAVWLIDATSVDFYDATGSLVKTLNLATEAARKAA